MLFNKEQICANKDKSTCLFEKKISHAGNIFLMGRKDEHEFNNVAGSALDGYICLFH